MILGIDPGLTGALALVEGDQAVCVWDMPTSERTSGKGQEVNAYLVADILEEALELAGSRGALMAVVELVGAMPGQGVTSMWRFGHSAGTIDGVLGALGVRHTKVAPVRWKAAYRLTGREKDAARTVAIATYPEIRDKLARKKDIGRADALLIAGYGVMHEEQ